MTVIEEFWMANLKTANSKEIYLGYADYEASGVDHFEYPCNAAQYETKDGVINFIKKYDLNEEDYEIKKYTLTRND